MFLRRLTTASMIAYGLSKSVDLLEKMKDYVTAVELLKLLLDTDFIYRYRFVDIIFSTIFCIENDNNLPNFQIFPPEEASNLLCLYFIY